MEHVRSKHHPGWSTSSGRAMQGRRHPKNRWTWPTAYAHLPICPKAPTRGPYLVSTPSRNCLLDPCLGTFGIKFISKGPKQESGRQNFTRGLGAWRQDKNYYPPIETNLHRWRQVCLAAATGNLASTEPNICLQGGKQFASFETNLAPWGQICLGLPLLSNPWGHVFLCRPGDQFAALETKHVSEGKKTCRRNCIRKTKFAKKVTKQFSV